MSISHSLSLPSSLYFDFFSLSFLSLFQLFLVGLNWWLLGLKWWVVSVIAGFGLVVVVWVLTGFHGGDRVWVTVEIRFGFGSQWRLGLRSALGFSCLSLFSRLGFSSGGSWCFSGGAVA